MHKTIEQSPYKHPDAPQRHPIAWQNTGYYDPQSLNAEMQRVFDVCHTCRRCSTLCDSFPILFDAIDDGETGTVDNITPVQTKAVADACTLCDLCFATKCPYVPPHELQIDFPHLILRYRANEHAKGTGANIIARELVNTDRNGKLGNASAKLSNWASKIPNAITRPLLEKTIGIDQRAYLPSYASTPLTTLAKHIATKPVQNATRKAVVYATCFANYNNPRIGEAALEVLARNGVHTALLYPQCCGMPQLEHGDLAEVAKRAKSIADAFLPWIEKGYQVISLTPSCSLMLKFEWPLIVQTPAITNLSLATKDISEYLLDIAQTDGLAEGLQSLDGGVTLHTACHSRAQHMDKASLRLLSYLPDTHIDFIERCSGHGGSWGVMQKNFTTALKVGKPVARTAYKNANSYLVSECALAREHILQGMEIIASEKSASYVDENQSTHLPIHNFQHPVELIAHAYKLGDNNNKKPQSN